MINVNELNFDKLNGLIPAIITDVNSGAVLMLGFMNKESIEKTIKGGKVTFYSRTKKRLWTKGETSGNFLHLKSIETDCDKDTILIEADPEGNTCHLERYSCFEKVDKSNIKFLTNLFELILSRKENKPENSYTAKLFEKGIDRIAQKVGEEAVETVIAAKNDDKGELIYESADLLYHLLVLLAEKDIHLEEVIDELIKRHK